MYFYIYFNFYTQVKLSITVTLESRVMHFLLVLRHGLCALNKGSDAIYQLLQCACSLIYKTEVTLHGLQGVLSIRLWNIWSEQFQKSGHFQKSIFILVHSYVQGQKNDSKYLWLFLKTEKMYRSFPLVLLSPALINILSSPSGRVHLILRSEYIWILCVHLLYSPTSLLIPLCLTPRQLFPLQ